MAVVELQMQFDIHKPNAGGKDSSSRHRSWMTEEPACEFLLNATMTNEIMESKQSELREVTSRP